MKRNVDQYLLTWKRDRERKVLLVRGARQVGKTYSIRRLGESFQHFVEVNFEQERDLRVFFQNSLDPTRICEKLSAYFSKPIVPGRTLLFFDEIQACPEAISSLRFFHEKMPKLHVVGAGSLLELVLEEVPSLGVGRLTSLFMYPLTFDEFLQALGEQGLSATVNTADAKHPIDQPIHRKLVDEVKTYQLIGGMPAVVKAYADKRDISACFKILDDLVLTLQDDFAKYKKRAPVSRLAEVFRSVVFQSGAKFKYSNVPSASYAHAVSEALRLLVQAGLTYRVTHTDARGIPLGAQSDETKFKTLMFDVGIHQRLLGLDIPEYLTAGDIELVNKGSLAEVFTGLEIIGNYPSHVRPALYYWHRETRGSNAEVDYVIQRGKQIIPIEVKAGVKGKMQSIRLFMQERGLTRGVRISLENFSEYAGIEVIPLYAVRRLASNRRDVSSS